MRLALDHHYSPLIAEGLRQRGHDAIAVSEAGWEAEDDETLLALCGDAGRALLTNDVADFTVLGRLWATDDRSHHGLIFTSDASLPRSRGNIGRYVDALEVLMRERPDVDGLVDRTHWLRCPPPRRPSESLAGRVRFVDLWPRSEGEIAGSPSTSSTRC